MERTQRSRRTNDDRNPTWSLLGVDMDDFSISGGVLSFSSPPDYEARDGREQRQRVHGDGGASNGGGEVAEVAVTVTVTNDTSDDTTTPTPVRSTHCRNTTPTVTETSTRERSSWRLTTTSTA